MWKYKRIELSHRRQHRLVVGHKQHRYACMYRIVTHLCIHARHTHLVGSYNSRRTTGIRSYVLENEVPRTATVPLRRKMPADWLLACFYLKSLRPIHTHNWHICSKIVVRQVRRWVRKCEHGRRKLVYSSTMRWWITYHAIPAPVWLLSYSLGALHLFYI